MSVTYKEWYDPMFGGRRWEITNANGVKAKIWKGDMGSRYIIHVLKKSRRTNGLLSAQAIALEMLGETTTVVDKEE